MSSLYTVFLDSTAPGESKNQDPTAPGESKNQDPTAPDLRPDSAGNQDPTADCCVSPSVSPSIISNDVAREKKTATEEPILAIVDALRGLGYNQADAETEAGSIAHQVGENAHLVAGWLAHAKTQRTITSPIGLAIASAKEGRTAPPRRGLRPVLANDRGAAYYELADERRRKRGAALSQPQYQDLTKLDPWGRDLSRDGAI